MERGEQCPGFAKGAWFKALAIALVYIATGSAVYAMSDESVETWWELSKPAPAKFETEDRAKAPAPVHDAGPKKTRAPGVTHAAREDAPRTSAESTPVRLTALEAVIDGTGHGYTSPMARGTWRSLGAPLSQTCRPYAEAARFTTRQRNCVRGMNAWNTAAFDQRNAIYMRGGGHFAYEGNEIYRFSLETGEWTRASDSGTAVKRTGDDMPNTYLPIYADGTPGSAHHYGHLTWADGRLVMGPMLGFGDPPTGILGIWEWSPQAGYVEAEVDLDPKRWSTIAICSAHDPRHDDVLISNKGLWRFDPSGDRLTRIGGYPHRQLSDSSCLFDAERGVFYDWKGPTLIAMNVATGVSERHVDVLPRKLSNRAGMAKRGDRIFMWNGERSVYAWNPARLPEPDFIELRNAETDESPAGCAARSCSAGNYGKWWYIDRLDVFVGIDDATEPVWVYRPPEELPQADPVRQKLAQQGFTCSDRVLGWECPDLQAAIADGGEVTLPKGEYRQCAVVKTPLTLDLNGSRVGHAVCNRKGIFVQNADLTLKNGVCAHARGGQGNEACVRRQKGRTRLVDMHVHDNFNGILGGTGAPVEIVDSTFENNGCCELGDSRPAGRAHSIYIADGTVTIRNSTFRAAAGQGHLIKSGARRTTILGSRLDERDGHGSRVIDAYNGGRLVVRNSDIRADAGDGNRDVIGYDHEGRIAHSKNEIIMEGNTIDCDYGRLLNGDNSLETAEIVRRDNTLTACR